MLCVCVFMRVCVVILSYNIDTSKDSASSVR